MNYPLVTDKVINIKDDIEFSMVADVIKKLVTNYLDYSFDKVVVIYNHYVNTLIQNVVSETVLPVSKPKETKESKIKQKTLKCQNAEEIQFGVWPYNRRSFHHCNDCDGRNYSFMY